MQPVLASIGHCPWKYIRTGGMNESCLWNESLLWNESCLWKEICLWNESCLWFVISKICTILRIVHWKLSSSIFHSFRGLVHDGKRSVFQRKTIISKLKKILRGEWAMTFIFLSHFSMTFSCLFEAITSQSLWPSCAIK